MVAEAKFNSEDMAKLGRAVREQITLAVERCVADGIDERKAFCAVSSMVVGVALGVRANALGLPVDGEAVARKLFSVLEGGQ